MTAMLTKPISLGPTGHVDTFTRDRLPPIDEWPDLLIDRPEFQYPEYLNVGVELTDRMVERGFGDHDALIGNGRRRTYKELVDWTNRLAHALVEDFGVKPGNRVLIRSGNNPAMVAAWLAVTKAGAVAVNTMPLLRAGELATIVDQAEIAFALCDNRMGDELVAVAKPAAFSAASSGSTAPRTTTPSSIASPSTSRYGSTPSERGETTWRCSASPRARPVSPRRRCTSTATC
jgi:acyl-CoA synthetase (AMP-forming)/AMP-acid ligase II